VLVSSEQRTRARVFSQWVVFSFAGASHSETGEHLAQEDFIPAAISPFSCLPLGPPASTLAILKTPAHATLAQHGPEEGTALSATPRGRIDYPHNQFMRLYFYLQLVN
jgi:hypothetical protein